MKIIYLETLKTQRFTSTVSFTGLTRCCFLFNTRDKQQLKEKATLKHIVLQSKELYKPRILVQIWSKSVEN